VLVTCGHVGNALLLCCTRRTRLAFLLSAVGLLGLVAASGWSGPEAEPRDRAGGDPLPRFMLICSNCNERTLLMHPPCRAEHRNGAVKCPKCGEFSAAKYRRGSQCMPAGG
jgi:hypothetical protein